MKCSSLFCFKLNHFSKWSWVCLQENNFWLITLMPGPCGWPHQYSSCLTSYIGSPSGTLDSIVLVMTSITVIVVFKEVTTKGLISLTNSLQVNVTLMLMLRNALQFYSMLLQPVGFVTFSTRAGAESAKQDLQVSAN